MDPKFIKGYLRKGAALHGLRKFEDAVFAYEEGLKMDPSNAQLLKGQDDVRRAMEAQAGPGGSMDPTNSLGKLFTDPQTMAKLAANPKTAGFMADPTFVNKIKDLSSGKGGQPDIGSLFQDPRMLTAMGVLMGIDLDAMERPAGSKETPENLKKAMATDEDPDDSMPGVESTAPAAATASSSSQPKRSAATVEDDDEPMPSASTSAKPAAAAASSSSAPVEEEDQAKKSALAHKAKGAEAYKARELDTAASEFQAAWEEWQGDVSFLTNLSAVQFEQGKYKECIETCEKAVEEGRGLRADYKVIAKALGRIGSAYEKEGDLENAIKYYSKSLTEHRTADILNKLKAAEKAKSAAEKAAYVNPELAEKAREEGNNLFKDGKFAEAVKAYTEAIRRLPTDARGYNNRAAAYTKLAALPEALKDAEEAIKVDPTFVKAYIRKSMVYYGMKEYTKAIDAAQQAMDQDVEKKHTREIEQHMQKCLSETYNQRQGETDEQTYERAMRDPEIQSIMVSLLRHLSFSS